MFKNLLKLVRARKISGVIVLKLDRLTRNMKDLLHLLEVFKKYGVRLVSVSENLDTGSASGRIFCSHVGVNCAVGTAV